MCNRYAFEDTVEALAAVFGASVVIDDMDPSYKILPTSRAPVIVPRDGALALVAGRFGFPGVVRGRKTLHLNAKSETVERLPAFAEHFQQRRCLVPATLFYENDPAGAPYAYRVNDAPVFGFPAIYAPGPADAPEAPHFCLLTAPANAAMTAINHPRMPLILEPGAHQDWLENAVIPEPLPAERFTWWPVSRRVNTSRTDPEIDNPSLLDRVDDQPGLF